MARINIEDALWSDPRFMKLCVKMGDEILALGSVVMAWRLAQTYFCPDRKAIPLKVAEESGINYAKLIEVGLADAVQDGIMMRGCEDNFAWLIQKIEAGRKGGEAKSRNAQKATDPALAVSSGGVAAASGAYPLTPTPTLSPTPKLHTSTEEGTKKKTSVRPSPTHPQENLIPPDKPPEATAPFVKAFCEGYKTKYKINPVMTGQEAGAAKAIVKAVGMDCAIQLVPTYLAMNDAWYIKRRHDLQTMSKNLNAVKGKHETGAHITSREAMKAEEGDHHKKQMQYIAERYGP